MRQIALSASHSIFRCQALTADAKKALSEYTRTALNLGILCAPTTNSVKGTT